MSRQESARAALRSLASPSTMKSNQMEDGGSGYPHSYSIPQGAASSSQASFFGNGSGSQIMDSPTSSPSLAALQSPPSSYRDSFGAGQGNNAGPIGRHAFLPQGKLLRDGSTGTSGTNEVPSLSLSNSSVSDTNLLSPYYETPQSQNHSISSIRTIKASDSASSIQSRRLEAIHRAAASMRIPVEEVQRGMEFVDKMNANRVDESQLAALDDIDREALRRISETVRSEEDRLAQIASFRAAYMQVESMRPEMELHHQSSVSSSSKRSSQQDVFLHQGSNRRRGNREGMIGMPNASRTMPPLSPPPAYEQLEMLEYDDDNQQHPHHHSMPPAPRSPSGMIPSPRAALESLSGGQHHHRNHPYAQAGYDGNQSSNQRYTHSRRTSGSRPLSLPDRSYRSMDDYVTDPLRNGSGTSGHLRRSMQAPYPPPASISRNSSRSPLIGDSPRLSGGLDVHPSYTDASSSPLLTTTNRLTPGVHGPHRKRSGSNTSNRSSSILSRRTSGDLLGLGIPRSTSPAAAATGTISQEHTPPKLTHEEVMARLQKKVKERIAAREAAIASGSGTGTIKRHSTPASTPASPAVSLQSIGGGGRRRQGSIANSIGGAPIIGGGGGSGSLSSRQRKPRKAVSLKSLAADLKLHDDGNEKEEKPLPALPKQSSDQVEIDEKDDDDAMSGVEQEFDPTASEGRLGIEALLSAAAIADSRA